MRRLTLIILLLSSLPSFADTVRISFLDSAAALESTARLLSDTGFSTSSIERYRLIVTDFNKEELGIDLSKFPTANGGFFEFDSMKNLIEAKPFPLRDSEHSFGINCFDSLIALAADRIDCSVDSDALGDITLVSVKFATNHWEIIPAASARDAFTIANPWWYQDITTKYFQGDLSEKRISLSASFMRCHPIQLAIKKDELKTHVIETVRRTWERQGLNVSGNAQILLIHQANYPSRWFVTAHAGLLIPQKKGAVYLEKAGGSGPFVRMDLDDADDLLLYFTDMFTGSDTIGLTDTFVTFNDEKIESIAVPSTIK